MLVCAFPCASMHTRPRVQRAPGLPCSLFALRGRTKWKASDKTMSRERGRMPDVVARMSEAISGTSVSPDVASLIRATNRTRLLVLATACARGLQITSPPKERGRREDRVRAAPAVSCAIDAQESAHTSIQVKRKHSGLPCAMALRLIRALPGESELLATIALERRWPLKDLTPAFRASGPHDFAVRATSLVL